MKKNWLIRTKNNHILGPVSKDKIKQLISNGSIKGDDEISSANGYWIRVREQELVSKYIFSEEIQTFNPVQEAEPKLAFGGDVSLYPSQADLSYPDDPTNSQTEDTGISINIKELDQETKQPQERAIPKKKE